MVLKIAFSSNRTGDNEIYVMNANGTEQTRLTTNPANDDFPAWSPDGLKIAFNSYRDGNTEIYVMNADGTGQTRLTNNPSYDGEVTGVSSRESEARSDYSDLQPGTGILITTLMALFDKSFRFGSSTDQIIKGNWQGTGMMVSRSSGHQPVTGILITTSMALSINPSGMAAALTRSSTETGREQEETG